MNANLLHVLFERSFLLLWIGEVFTQIATNLFNFFLILLVFNLTHSNTAVSGVVLSFTIPAILFGSLAGAYVDHWDKKKVLMISNFLRAVLLIVLVFNLHNLAMIYFISFLFSILVQFFIPAESPMIPLVVKPKNLLSANALFGLAIFGSILVAFILSGPLLLWLKPVKLVLLLSLMLIVGGVFISFIKFVHKQQDVNANPSTRNLHIFRALKHTLKHISESKHVFHAILMLSLSQILTLILATIAPGYASQVLNISIEEFPIVFIAPAALGMVIGAITLVHFYRNRPKEKIILIGIFLSGIAMLLLPFGSKIASRSFIQVINSFLPHIMVITTYHIMIFLAFLLGVANSFVFVPANTILQEKTSEDFRGKIYGFLSTATGILSLLPIILAGGLADLVGVGAVITGIGVSILLLGFVQLFALKK
jgi:MFS family permease